MGKIKQTRKQSNQKGKNYNKQNLKAVFSPLSLSPYKIQEWNVGGGHTVSDGITNLHS
jgi:hypothetical protein